MNGKPNGAAHLNGAINNGFHPGENHHAPTARPEGLKKDIEALL